MGYTHYWRQLRSFSAAEWQQMSAEIQTILDHAEHRYGIRLCNGAGDRGTKPEFFPSVIMFNGSGDEAHETFLIDQARPKTEAWQEAVGSGFCKTARKPYDTAVTAVLCYLSAFHLLGDENECKPLYSISSDGAGRNFMAGLELARQALPRYSNLLDLPRGVLEDDRWCPPWPSLRTPAYSFRFCVDGHAYVTRNKDSAVFRFHSHRAAAEFAMLHNEKPITVKSWAGTSREGGSCLFRPMGAFNERRNRALARQQSEALSDLFGFGPEWMQRFGELGHQPPALVRPDEMPAIEAAYSFADLLKEVNQAA